MKTRLCTVCYLEKDDKILMLYRNKKENDINKGKWIGVGGHIEDFESPYECAVREIREETGLIAKNLKFRGLITFVLKDEETQYLYVFSTKDFEGNIINCDEGELRFINKKDIMKLNLWESDRFFMNKIINEDYSFFMIKAIYENDKLLEEIREII